MAATVEQMVVQELLATPAVTALVGSRIYPQMAPQNTTADYLTYELVSEKPLQDLGGTGSLARVRLSVLCHAVSYAGAKGAAEAVRARLDGFRGTMQGVTVGSLLVEMEADAGWDPETRMHVVGVDFRGYVQG
jgi:hypothetical protein